MKTVKLKWVSILLVAVLALSVLAGCSSGGGSGGNGGGSSATPSNSADKPEALPDSTPAQSVPQDESPVIYDIPDYSGEEANFSVAIPAGIKVSDIREMFGKINVKVPDGPWTMLIGTSAQESLENVEKVCSTYGWEASPYSVGGNDALLVINRSSDGSATVSLDFVTPSKVNQLGIIETSGVTDIDGYLNDPIVKAILDSVSAPEGAGGGSVGSESVEMASYSTASLTIEAPSGWIEQLNKTDFGTEMWRLVSDEDWMDDPDAKIISVTYVAEGDEDSDSMVKSLQFSYPQLQENGDVTKGGKSWRHMSAAQNRKSESVVYNAYFGEAGGRLLLVDFKGISADDPVIDAVLAGVKTK